MFEEVFFDVSLCDLRVDPEFLGQTIGTHSVNDAEVDDFGLPAHQIINPFRWDTEDLCRRTPMHVFSLLESGRQGRISGDVG